MKTTVYLCGGINGLSDADAKDWRETAKERLHAAGFGVLNPMGRDYRGKEAESVEMIVQGDLLDIGNSGVVLVNASKPSWGTAMEVMYAARCVSGKKVVAFGAGERPSPWLIYHCDRLFQTLEEAVDFIAAER